MKCLQALTLAVLAMVPALVWQARNHAVAGYDRLATVEDLNLYFYNAASILARQRGITVGTAQSIEMGYSTWPSTIERIRNKPIGRSSSG